MYRATSCQLRQASGNETGSADSRKLSAKPVWSTFAGLTSATYQPIGDGRAPLRIIAERLGHKTQPLVMRYAHLSRGHL